MVISVGPIGRDPAQRLARQELSKPIYHQTSIPQEILHAIEQFLERLFGGASQATPGGWWTLVALAAVLAAVIAVIVTRLGPLRTSARRATPVREPGAKLLTARQYREAAAESAAQGDYSTAILQRFLAARRTRAGPPMSWRRRLPRGSPVAKPNWSPRPACSTRSATATAPVRKTATSTCVTSTMPSRA